MNTIEEKEKKTETQQIDPLYFVVRELDSIKANTREEFDKVYKEFDRVYEEFDKVYKEFDRVYKEFDKIYARFDKIEAQIHDLRSFTVKLVFSMAALIIAGVGIMFQIMR